MANYGQIMTTAKRKIQPVVETSGGGTLIPIGEGIMGPLMRKTDAQPPGITSHFARSRELSDLVKQEKEVNKLLMLENARAPKPRPIVVARLKQALVEIRNKMTASRVKARKAEWGRKEAHNAFFTMGDLGATEAAPSVLSKLTSFFTTGTGAKLVSSGAGQLALKQQGDLLKKQQRAADAQRRLLEASGGGGTQMASGTLLTIGAIAAGGALLLSMKGKKRGRRR